METTTESMRYTPDNLFVPINDYQTSRGATPPPYTVDLGLLNTAPSANESDEIIDYVDEDYGDRNSV